MVGLGETNEEILQVMRDLRSHGVTMLTIGQYLQPSKDHLPVERYVHPMNLTCSKKKRLKWALSTQPVGHLYVLHTMPTSKPLGKK